MSHTVRFERDQDAGLWWVCDHCHDRWRRPPSDICDPYLAQLEAEMYAGWATVTPQSQHLERLLSLLASVVKDAA